VFAADGRDGIIGHLSNRHGIVAVESIRAGSGNGQYMNIDAEPVHMLDPALDVTPFKDCCVDTTSQLFVIEISHAAVRIGLFENHRAVTALELVDVLFGK
jgi:hypothetical protein